MSWETKGGCGGNGHLATCPHFKPSTKGGLHRPPIPEPRVRREALWHGGHTRIVFQDVGPHQMMINVVRVGTKAREGEARDSVTGERVESSLCLRLEDLQELRNALHEMAIYAGEVSP